MKIDQSNKFYGVYFKILREHYEYPLNYVANKCFVDIATLSKFENGKLTLKEQELLRLKNFFHVEHLSPITKEQQNEFYFLLYTYLYKIQDETIQFEKKPLNLTSSDYPFQLVRNFCISDLYRIKNTTFKEELALVLKYIKFYPKFFQKVIYMFLGFYYSNKNDEMSYIYLKKALEIREYEEIDGLIYSFLIPVYSSKKEYAKALNSFNKGYEIFNKYGNKNRFYSLYGNLALMYSQIEEREEAIQLNLKCIELIPKNDTMNLFTVFSNIAYQYLLLKKYGDALMYYGKAEAYYIDICSCFETAWCYYNLNQKEKVYQYLNKAEELKEGYSHYRLFNQWLYAMYQKKYSKKCLQILLRIEKELAKSLSGTVYRFLCDRIIEHYLYHKEYEQAFYYSEKARNSF